MSISIGVDLIDNGTINKCKDINLVDGWPMQGKITMLVMLSTAKVLSSGGHSYGGDCYGYN